MLCRYLAVTTDSFFHLEMKIDHKLLLTKAAPIALLNLAIIHWSLSKKMT